MSVEESIEYLEALYHRPIRPAGEVGLSRVRYLLDRLGNPHQAFRSLHVTGSCGKGSTTTMAGAILSEAGLRVGLFRSPHLDSYLERIAIGEEIIGEADWVAGFRRVRAAAETMERGEAAGYELGRVSLFELLWALAALYFAEAGVDVAAVEVGLGGRLDPTNVLEPEVSVLTNVSLEHTNILGPRETDIAREKAGIIKAGIPSVSGVTNPDVVEIVEDRARTVGSSLWLIDRDIQCRVESRSLAGEVVNVTTPSRGHVGLRVSMLGEHQARNAAAAVAAVDIVGEAGLKVGEPAYRRGLERAFIPGRFEVMPGAPPVVLDGARNAASARVLKQTIQELFPCRRVVLLIGLLSDKDAAGVVAELGPGSVRAVVTRPPYETRAGDPRVLVEMMARHVHQVEYREEVAEALELALSQLGPDDVLVVTGSLYLVAAVRRLVMGTAGIEDRTPEVAAI